MSWTISAPYPLFLTAMTLPSPEMGNFHNIESRVQHHQMMDGSYVTHIQNNPHAHTYTSSFSLTRRKALELKEFYRLYHGELWQFLLHDDSVLVGVLKNNPLVLEMVSRGVTADSKEVVPITLEIETV